MRRLISIALTIALLLGCCVVAAASDNNAPVGTGVQSQEIVFIPVDDRPFSDGDVRVFADSLGMTLITPDRSLYASKLDGQTDAPGNNQYGDRGALLRWLREQDADHDTFVISLDQLLSGGLMNSRTMTHMEPISLGDNQTLTEYEVIDYLSELAENNTVYIIDSVLRLACSSEYNGYSLEDYYVTLLYGRAPRPRLTGSRLTVDDVVANYRRSVYSGQVIDRVAMTDKQKERLLCPFYGVWDPIKPEEELPEPGGSETEEAWKLTDLEAELVIDREILPENQMPVVYASAPMDECENSLLSVYLSVRERKLRLTDYALQKLMPQENVHYLLGIDDTTEGNSIQTNEIALYESLIGSGDCTIVSAMDGLSHMAVSKLFQEQSGIKARYSVEYFGDDPNQVVGYTCVGVKEQIEQLTGYFGGSIVNEDPDFEVLAFCDSASNATKDENFNKLVMKLKQNQQEHIPTVVILISSISDDQKKALSDKVMLGMLLSFSGSCDDAARAVMGMSKGLARYGRLALGATDEQNTAYGSMMLSSMLRSFRDTDTTNSFLRLQNIDTGNFGKLSDEERKLVSDNLTENTRSYNACILDSFLAHGVLTGVQPYEGHQLSRAEIIACDYPWQRNFEISCQVDMEISDVPTLFQVSHNKFIDGISETRFDPEGKLTREQAAKLLVSISETELSDAIPHFTDTSTWAAPYVQTAYENGYMKGYSSVKFGGEDPITRAQFAVMIMQYMDAKELEPESIRTMNFSDVSEDIWYADSVYALANAGILNGTPEGLFLPERPISRAEAVAVLSRVFGREHEEDDPSIPQRFVDVPTSHWAYVYIQKASNTHLCPV